MKHCPKCNKTYDGDDVSFCLDDGTPLKEISSGAEAETLIYLAKEKHISVNTRSTDPVIKYRPFVIALVYFGELPGVDIEKLKNELNRAQVEPKLFDYRVVPGPKSLGGFDLPHSYSDDKLFGLIKSSIKGTGHSYGIGLTAEGLELARFNSHVDEDGVGLVTVYNHDQYKPPEKTLHQYLAFLILCESFCITGQCHFEHDDKHYCLFDECSEKKDLKICLRDPKIHCEAELKKAGFTNADILNANRILAYVRKRSVANALIKTLGNPVVGILLGGGIVNLLASSIAALGVTWIRSITAMLFLGILAIFLYNYFQPAKK